MMAFIAMPHAHDGSLSCWPGNIALHYCRQHDRRIIDGCRSRGRKKCYVNMSRAMDSRKARSIGRARYCQLYCLDCQSVSLLVDARSIYLQGIDMGSRQDSFGVGARLVIEISATAPRTTTAASRVVADALHYHITLVIDAASRGLYHYRVVADASAACPPRRKPFDSPLRR